MTQPGFPSNPNVSMPIGPQPVTEGYGGMGGGRLGGLMSFFQSMMGQRGGPRMNGSNIQDMLERMRSRQGDPRRDNLFRRYGAPPPPQQPGNVIPQKPVGSPVPGQPPQFTPGQITALINGLNPGLIPGPPMTPQQQEQHEKQMQLQKLQLQQEEQLWLQQHPGETHMPMF
jgi:hypothetical protein